MEFEWDENKSRINVAKHGIGFGTAARIFEGPTVDWIDDREAYGEERTVSIGMIDGVVVLVVVHVDRSGRTRSISARRATRSERSLYETALRKGTDT